MKFSIVTPSFRQFDYLKRCVRSVGDQASAVGVEHIIQDASGDQASDCFMEFVTELESVHFVQENDEGMYDAINRGFKKSQGEIVSWLNCDEQYLPKTLEKVAQWFDANPEKDILFGDVILIDSHGELLSYRKAMVPNRNHILACFLPTYSAATFVRRRVIKEGFFLDDNYKAIADAVWIRDLLGEGFVAGVLNEPLAVFTQTGENLGQTEISHLEHEVWKKSKGSVSSVNKYFLSVMHRFRKLINGCYLPKWVNVSIYQNTQTSRQLVSKTLGGVWKTKK
ncbi:glycosyltransferase [Rubritalea profundi]|uniref:Glycosyltransferase 2-like domain-containing protein n=1 Tax=Rubritalea profundi TaxID=1658618 RepID=A0A2S7TZ98_9BACT|nr:glycosyltransferase [Rubritalea profundi]PQJ28078.1 hypothetical protein BSZ32_05880 [Rubritalea profundi]